MEKLVADPHFWQGRRVFLTGHTGFKGGWLALWLSRLGANVRGYALDPSTSPSFFEAANIASVAEDIRGDLRHAIDLERAIHEFAPEIIFHLAAQPLVRSSYADPVETYSTNVMGTVHLLDAVRRTPSVRAVLCITTDKCYENREWIWPYRETDPLGGYDPYSSSKACAELVTASFRQSYFHPSRFGEHRVAVATARAGNVIGGGDWSTDRLIPDLIRGFLSDEPVRIRHPKSIRPWQHVLEPLHGYIILAERLLVGTENMIADYASAFNFGPRDEDARPVSWIVDRMARAWGDEARWMIDEEQGPHEAHHLKLDISRAGHFLSWRPQLCLETAIDWSVDWYRSWKSQPQMQRFSLQQIVDYESLVKERAKEKLE